MNENLAYWQLDFTVESQANLAPDCMVMQEKSKSLLYSTPRPSAARGLLPSTIFRYFLQSLVSSPNKRLLHRKVEFLTIYIIFPERISNRTNIKFTN